MLTKVSLGIAGLGTIAQTQHLPNIAELEDAFGIAAIADLSPRLIAAVADRLPGDVVASQDWRDLCADPNVDAVLLLTPGAHGHMTEQALRADKHVFVEKPLCLTVATAQKLAALARDRGLVLQVGYMKLHEQPLDEFRRSLDLIGDHRLVRHTVFHPEPEAQLTHTTVLRFDDADPGILAAAARFESERTAVALGDVPPAWGHLYREVLQGSLVHSVSLIRGALGALPSITDAELWPADALRSEDSEPPSLRVGGMLGDAVRVELNWLWLPFYPVYREVLEVHGTSGSLQLTLPPPYLRRQAAELAIRAGEDITRHGGGAESAFVRELAAFHRAVTKGAVLDDAAGAAEDIAWLEELLRVLAGDAGVTVGGEAGSGR